MSVYSTNVLNILHLKSAQMHLAHTFQKALDAFEQKLQCSMIWAVEFRLP